MEKFLSCDWGTSSFRLKLVEITSAKVIAEENTNHGIAKVFEAWKQKGKPENERFHFYLDIVNQHITSIEQKLNSSLDEFPLVISGMACSSLGMIDLPYKELPFSTDGSDLVTKIIKSDHFKHGIIIISGAKTNDDAMRGEETQLMGCVKKNDQENQIFIFPGTHSKHVTVKNGKTIDLETFMTGEFFELLSEKSILSASVEKGLDVVEETNMKAFEEGVKESLHSNLLNSAFKLRTNDLFQKFTKRENYYYLSGLLIGTEMKEFINNDHDVTLVSNSHLVSFYETAFEIINNKERVLKIENADEALVRGQLKVLKQLIFDQETFF
jgi:2-dehydro-3-deoxygalactonokinase